MFDLLFLLFYPALVPLAMSLSFRRNDNVAWSIASAFFGHLYMIYWLFVSDKGKPLFKGLSEEKKSLFLKFAIIPSATFYVSLVVGFVYYESPGVTLVTSLVSLLSMIGMFVFPAMGLKKIQRWRAGAKKH